MTIDNQNYNVIITKKRTTKNMYLRVKEDMNLYVTCNVLVTDQMIYNFILKNEHSVIKMLSKITKKKKKEEYFYYLGKKYDIVYLNNDDIHFGENKVFVNTNFNFNKWYQKEAQRIFKEELDKMYHQFKYNIPYPSSLVIRKMKTRWGVCNVKTCKITLNLELIKKSIIYLDYVIVHELSHLLYPNHSANFWKCVEDNFSDYKKVRKELKEDE